ncbi:uncharacterized protein EAE98_003851 [Botrytis deweyae]|uniref:SRCR domain-containing protein n=1 Tax=Botrytis deweyae TaxID=2478750 RepID=A0ABQ7IRX4_9HELO|nr:uncharacterized protein EAE98_003851 [Botrytis deweyae]KAF7932552.1 hypothetical protein EAE98_003851 [Botrytis deweyae]
MDPLSGNTTRKGKGQVSRGSSSTTGNTRGNRGGGESSANSGRNPDRPLDRSSNLASNPTAEQAGGRWQCELPLPGSLNMFSCNHWNKSNTITCEAAEKNPFKSLDFTNPNKDQGCGRQRLEGFWTLGHHVSRLNLYHRKIDQIPDIDWVVMKDGSRVRGNEER